MAFNFHKDFWSQDRTTLHQRYTWFTTLPPIRKLTYGLLFLFVISWCFYIGLNASAAYNADLEYFVYTSSEDNTTVKDPIDYTKAELEGMDVVLLIGADKRPGETSYRTDTIILAFIDWEKLNISILSIPRDSYVQLPGTGTKTKINAAYFSGGISLLKNTIEYTFGIHVDNYVELDFEGFAEVVDAIGGITVDVPRRMYKPSEGINLQAGLQNLNGSDALAFVRFRDMLQGDIDRIANQQIFIKAAAEQLMNASTLTKLPSLLSILMENCKTDFSLKELTSLGTLILKTDFSELQMYSAPGVGKYIGAVSYWILDEAAYSEMIMVITDGKMDGDLHILTDGGRGTYSAPSKTPTTPVEEETPEDDGTEANPDLNTPTEGEETDVVVEEPTDESVTPEQPSDGGTENTDNPVVEPTPPADSGNGTEGNGDFDPNSIPEPTETDPVDIGGNI